MVAIDLRGKYILTTGGLGAIAEYVTRRLIEAGAFLLVTDVLAKDEGETRLRSLDLPANSWRYFSVDVTEDDSVSTGLQDILEHFPETDCVVALSGGCALHPFSQTSAATYVRIFDYNYHGHVRVARVITEIWTRLKIKGHMLFTSSLVGSLPWVDLSAYAPAKAALEMLTKCLALEFAGQGFRFNCVAPGHVATGSSLKVYEEDDAYRSLVDRAIPLQRLVRPESIADAYLWLTSSLAQDVNGQVIRIDCGASIPKVG